MLILIVLHKRTCQRERCAVSFKSSRRSLSQLFDGELSPSVTLNAKLDALLRQEITYQDHRLKMSIKICP